VASAIQTKRKQDSMEQRTYDRKYMELAVETMLESRSEHPQRPDPLVGAALVDIDGNLLGHVSRGDLRVGAHAEYQLIDRLCRNDNLEGATLYVTLEPCTTRGPGRTPCAERVISARIGRVFIGMVDPNPDIEGHGIAMLMKSGVSVGFFDKDLSETIQLQNKEFIEYHLAVSELDDEPEEFAAIESRERELVGGVTVDRLEEFLIFEYMEDRNEQFPVPSDELWSYLEQNHLVGRDSEGVLRPTVAGFLLLSMRPSSALGQMPVMVEANLGSSQVTDEIDAALTDVPDLVVFFLRDHMRYFTVIDGTQRMYQSEYPEEALREAVVNALVHRSLLEGARVHIKLLHDRIEIHSPGLPIPPLSIEQLQRLQAPPFSRNPVIASAMRIKGLMDERGSGIRRMRDTMASSGLGEPSFSSRPGYLLLTLPGVQHEWAEIRFEGKAFDQLSESEKAILVLVQEKGWITTAEAASLLGIQSRGARKHVAKLVAAGFLRRQGESTRTRYTPCT
jgi:ATP-dependent DNA helicase RecG